MTTREFNDNDNDNEPHEAGRPDGAARAEPPANTKGNRLGREAVELPKRFYASVATSAIGRGFGVLLDGRPIKTPAKSQVIVPTLALAEALAADWQRQGERIDPASMSLTRIVNTTLDAVMPNIEAVRADLVAFAGSDALCYRAADPAALTAQQAEAWDPVLAWAATALGARFVTVNGILHAEQPDTTLKAIGRAVETYSAWEIAPIHVMTTLTGSVVLALAIAHQFITDEVAWRISHIDEDWQIATWGEDEEAKIRRAGRWRELRAASLMLETLR